MNGLRVTDEETMEIAEMVLGRVNKNLVTMVEELGVKAVGISGKDGGLLKVEKKYSDGKDIGFVGNITEVDPKVIYDLLEKDFLPIIAPIGLDENFQTYNINADDAACAIAKAVGADKLVFLTDIEGLYRDINDKSTFISRLTASQAESLISEGDRGRHAAETGKLYLCGQKRRKPGAYSGRKDSPLHAAGDFHQSGNRNGHHSGRRHGIEKRSG